MKIFNFGAPKPESPPPLSLEEKLAQAVEEATHAIDSSHSSAAPDGSETETEDLSRSVDAPSGETGPAMEAPLNPPEDPMPTEPAPTELSSLFSLPEPPRALFPGSFLRGELEIKEVISRGAINFYLADAGDYGASDYRLVAQRRAPETSTEIAPASPFFPPATRFVDDGHEFAVWDFENLKSLEDWVAHPHDETYLSVVGDAARGLLSLEEAGLQADFARDSLFFDAAGNLKSFGFFDLPGEGNAASMSAVEQLSALSSRFAKTNLGGGATLRLDDEFGALPLSEEVKSFARALSDGDFESSRDVVAVLDGFALPQKTELAMLTDVGMERELNEDCGLAWKISRGGHARNFELEVLAVADGMGGHEGGEVASDLTLSALETAISRRQNLEWHDNAAILAALGEILVEVNDAVVRLTENPPYASMRNKPGATLVCALRVGARVFIGNVGDSRAYRWNTKSGLQRLTKDHSYVQDLLDSGSLQEDQAWGHPDGSIITSHIGMMRGQKRDVFLRLLCQGDRLVLVSDGVVDTMRDEEIEAVIAQNGDVSALCAALVSAANDAGGIDNITVAALICS